MGDAEIGVDVGAISVAGGGATCGVVGTVGGNGLAPPAARPLANPWDRSLAAVVGAGVRPAGLVGADGMLGVLGMDGVDGMEGIDGVRMGLAEMPDDGGVIGVGMIPVGVWAGLTAGDGGRNNCSGLGCDRFGAPAEASPAALG